MLELQQILNKTAASCVIRNQGEIRIFQNRGIKDLYELYQTEPHFLKGADIADKVVGKAAASIMCLGGVANLHTPVISHSALDILKNRPIKVSYNQEVPYIINRQQNGWCPLEKATYHLTSLDDIWQTIDHFIKEHQ